MAQPSVYEWTAANTTAVAALQSLAGAGSLTLNGSLVPAATPRQGFVQFPKYVRSVSLTSANNLSGVNFTIHGVSENGSDETQTIAGPNANTVETTNVFYEVTAITTNGAAAAVSAGTGHIGHTFPFLFNYNSPYPALGIACDVTNGAGAITYSFTCFLADLGVGNAAPFHPIAAMTGATTDQIAVLNIPIMWAEIDITASTLDASLQATFIQQGIV